ncbi:hypothetical protein BKA62DRAFT_483190 [Auriculariales sp. MPI-PUGE-AT-0066]|nr:hypothetical protein BKA62DRAFT_483190 [Auriculariales sp. MPI-PUGE-AT-0066]
MICLHVLVMWFAALLARIASALFGQNTCIALSGSTVTATTTAKPTPRFTSWGITPDTALPEKFVEDIVATPVAVRRRRVIQMLTARRNALALQSGYCWVKAVKLTRLLTLVAILGPMPTPAQLAPHIRSFNNGDITRAPMFGNLSIEGTYYGRTVMHLTGSTLHKGDLRALNWPTVIGSNTLNQHPPMTGVDALSGMGYLPPQQDTPQGWWQWARNAFGNRNAAIANNTINAFPDGNARTGFAQHFAAQTPVDHSTIPGAPAELAASPAHMFRMLGAAHNSNIAALTAAEEMAQRWGATNAQLAQANTNFNTLAHTSSAAETFATTPKWDGNVITWGPFVRALVTYARMRHALIATEDHRDALILGSLTLSQAGQEAYYRWRATAVFAQPADAAAAETMITDVTTALEPAVGITPHFEEDKQRAIWNMTWQTDATGRKEAWSMFRDKMLFAATHSGYHNVTAPGPRSTVRDSITFAHLAQRADKTDVERVLETDANWEWANFDAAMTSRQNRNVQAAIWGGFGAPTTGSAQGLALQQAFGVSANGYAPALGLTAPTAPPAPQPNPLAVKQEAAKYATTADVEALVRRLTAPKAKSATETTDNNVMVQLARLPDIISSGMQQALAKYTSVAPIGNTSAISHQQVFGTSGQRAATLTTCYNWWCLGTGHYARDCPKVRPDGMTDGPVRTWTNDNTRKAYYDYLSRESKRLEQQGKYDDGRPLEYIEQTNRATGGKFSVVNVNKNRNSRANAVTVTNDYKTDAEGVFVATGAKTKATFPTQAWDEHTGALTAELRAELDRVKVCYQCRTKHSSGDDVTPRERVNDCKWDAHTARWTASVAG